MADSTLEVLIRIRTATGKVVDKLNTDLKKAADNAKKLGNVSTSKLNAQLKTASTQSKDTGDSVKTLATRFNTLGRASLSKLSGQVTKLRNTVKAAATDTKRLTESMKRSGQSLREAGTAAAAFGIALGLPIVASLRNFAEFERTMARVKAVTAGITENEFAEMTRVAKELGSTTEFTANQAAAGFVFLSQAGLSANESIAALPATLQLATAGNLELATAADLATNVLASFGLGVDQLSRVNDVLAFTASNANTNVGELGEGVKVAGAIARASGQSLEGIVSVLGALGDVGIKGAEAGTAVRNMLLRLQKPTREAKDALARLNVETTDSEGNFRGLQPILRDLGTANLSAADSARIFGIFTAGAGVNAANSTKKIETLNKGLADSSKGFAASVQTALLNTLTGDIDLFTSAVAGVGQTLGAVLAPAIRSIVQSITGVINAVNAWAEANPRLSATLTFIITTIVSLAAILGTIAVVVGASISGFGILITALAPLAGVLSSIGSVIGSVVAGFVALKVALVSLLASTGAIGFVALALAIAAVGKQVLDVVSNIGKWQDAEKVLTDIEKEKLSIIEELNKQGANDVQIKSAEELAQLTKEQNLLYKEQLKDSFKLVSAQISLFIAQGQSETLIKALKAEQQEILNAAEETVKREEEFSKASEDSTSALKDQKSAVLGVSAELKRTVTDAQDLSRAQQAIADLKYDQNIDQLKTVRDEQVKVLKIVDDLPGITEAYNQHFSNVTDLASERADSLKSIAKNEVDQILAIQLAASENDQQKARVTLQARQALSDRVIQIQRQEIDTVKQLRQDAFNQLKSLNQQSANLATQIADAETSGEIRVRELRRQGLSDFQSFNDKKKEIGQLTSKFNKALADGDFDTAKQLANRQISLSGQLVGEVKDGERVILTREQSVQTALGQTEGAQNRLVAALKAQKAEVDAAKNSQQELLSNLDVTLSRLSTVLEQGLGNKLKIESEFIPPDISNIRGDLDSSIASLGAGGVKVPITVEFGEESFNGAIEQGNVLASETVINTLLQAAFKEGELQNKILEAEASLAEQGINVDLLPNKEKFDLVKAEIFQTAIQQNVEFNFSDDRIREIITQLKTPTSSDHTVTSNADIVKTQIASLDGKDTASTHTINIVENRAVGGFINAVRNTVPGFAEGTPRAINGNVSGPGTGTSDSIMARLSNGEFVVRASAVKKYGQSLFQGLNSMRFDKNKVPAFAEGGAVSANISSIASLGANTGSQGAAFNIVLPTGQSIGPFSGDGDSTKELKVSLGRESLKFGRRSR